MHHCILHVSMKSTPFLTYKKDSGTASLVLFIAQSALRINVSNWTLDIKIISRDSFIKIHIVKKINNCSNSKHMFCIFNVTITRYTKIHVSTMYTKKERKWESTEFLIMNLQAPCAIYFSHNKNYTPYIIR